MSGTSLLLIDADPSTHALLQRRLDGIVDEVSHAVRAGQGISLARSTQPDVILLDLEVSETDGFKVCVTLENDPRTRDIPVLFFAAAESEHLIARALDTGATDYISRPFKAVELQARIRAAIRMHRLIRMLRHGVQADPVTGLRSRNEIEAALDRGLEGATPEGLGVLRINVGGLETLNQKYGFAVGDELLCRAAELFSEFADQDETVGRFGGATFVGVLNRDDRAEAERNILSLMKQLELVSVRRSEELCQIHCTAGLCWADAGASSCTRESLLEKASDAAASVSARSGNLFVTYTSREAA